MSRLFPRTKPILFKRNYHIPACIDKKAGDIYAGTILLSTFGGLVGGLSIREEDIIDRLENGAKYGWCGAIVGIFSPMLVPACIAAYSIDYVQRKLDL